MNSGTLPGKIWIPFGIFGISIEQVEDLDSEFKFSLLAKLKIPIEGHVNGIGASIGKQQPKGETKR